LIESDSKAYPLYLANMATYAPNTCFGATVDSDLLIAFGMEVVHETAQPIGDVITEGPPELRPDGNWYQTWVTRSFSEVELTDKLAERKAVLLVQAETLRVTAFAIGFPYTFPDNNVYHVQVRASDRGNISDMRTIAKEMIEANQPMTFPFRVYENIPVGLSAEEMVALANRTFQQVVAGYQVGWDYKDAITAATSFETLPAAPTVFFTM
jgi:hypothetical protein